jgi:hypothetical protein
LKPTNDTFPRDICTMRPEVIAYLRCKGQRPVYQDHSGIYFSRASCAKHIHDYFHELGFVDACEFAKEFTKAYHDVRQIRKEWRIAQNKPLQTTISTPAVS